jgi:hypothetical protein
VARGIARAYNAEVLASLLAAAGLALAVAQPASPVFPPELEEEPVYDEEERPPRLRVSAWGGALYDVQAQDSIPLGGGQLAWSFDSLDVGVLAQAYRFGRERARSEWSPVVLARLEQRFESRRGLEAVVGFGVGAGRERSWNAWFQFTGGFRATKGPLFAGAEFGFEQDRFFRLAATLGVAVF